MRSLLPLGRLFLCVALVGWGIQNFIYGDFMLGRAPAWPAAWPGQRVFADLTGLFFIAAGFAIALRRAPRLLAFTGAAIVFGWALVRHLIAFLPHFNTGVPFTETGKALTLFGGLLAIAGTTSLEAGAASEPLVRKESRQLVLVGRLCLGIFLFDCGLQHFLWAKYVAPLVPDWIGHAMFWTYAAGVFLVAGGAGMILPWTARFAAACSGLMVFLWFVMLHIPRTVADPHSRSDWLAVFEALGFAGIAFAIAGALSVLSVRPETAIEGRTPGTPA